jgi:hypothetical protein
MYAQEFKEQISDGQAIETFVQATDADEITYDVVVDQIRRHSSILPRILPFDNSIVL